MSDPFKDALRKSSQKLNCCCDTGLVCPTHGAMGKTSDTPETDAHAMDWHRQGMVSTEGGAWVGVYLARRLERHLAEARKEVANWKHLYAEAVERGNLFQSQRDEARAEVARLQMKLDASCNSEELRQVREENARLRDALDTLTLVIGLTPISGNKEALQEALDNARKLLTS